MQLTPTITIHLTAALGALVIGPLALWARMGATQRPMLHRAAGYAWVTLMLITAVSAMFIRDYSLPNIGGYTPIHLLVPFTMFSLIGAFRALAQRNYVAHRRIMQNTYLGACVVAGAFTLLPSRYLGKLVWGQFPFALQVLAGTPLWVWGLLAGLVALGVSQSRDRQARLPRIVLMPLGLVAFSIFGLIGDFGGNALVVGSWLAAVVLAALAVTARPLPAGVRYDAATRQFSLPGSWVPLGIILGIFVIKYVAGVSLSLQPALHQSAAFALVMSGLSGVFSGLFLGRMLRLVRLARQASGATALPVSASPAPAAGVR